jgi:hypothetical protein
MKLCWLLLVHYYGATHIAASKTRLAASLAGAATGVIALLTSGSLNRLNISCSADAQPYGDAKNECELGERKIA